MNQQDLTRAPLNDGCRVQGSVADAADDAQEAALDSLEDLDGDGWTGYLEGSGILDPTYPTPTAPCSWVGRAVNGMEDIMHMLTAAAASASVAPASGPLAAAAAAAAAAAGSPSSQHMMDMLVPMELQPWQSYELRDTGSGYSGAAAMRPLREWLAMRGTQFGPELVAAIILRFG